MTDRALRSLGGALLVCAVALTLAAPSCTATTYCRTRCGLALLAPSDCAALQAEEDAALRIYDQRGIFSYATACAALRGYAVGIPTGLYDAGSEQAWTDAWGRTVVGETSCDLHRIAVTSTRWHSQSNALAHELVHAIEHCADGPHGETHYRWYERGIPDAIEAARPEP